MNVLTFGIEMDTEFLELCLPADELTGAGNSKQVAG